MLRWMLIAVLISASFPATASAHLVNSGLGPYYDGIAHLFVAPEDVLTVIALALLAGLGGRPHGRVVLAALPAAWFVGVLAGRVLPLATGVPVLSAALLIAIGALVAADRRLPLAFIAGIAIILGLLKGCINGAALTSTGSSALAGVGIGCAVFIVVALVAGQTVELRPAWTRIAVRVAGSWIAAIGLLMLGWAARHVTVPG